ncbi:DUF6907 domain-containing protein [Streptomyces sp. NPDC057697]|uniref:DUF6907 domain-containing protein n=1 Tax=Streptomyces sp. NPDC057697 TaxID=3346219 RepID=UPI00367FB8AD
MATKAQAEPSVGTEKHGHSPRTWVRRVENGGQITEYCPTYCTDHHTNDQDECLSHLFHGFHFERPEVAVFDAKDGTALAPILQGRIQIAPYDQNPRLHMPHLVFEPFQDEVMECVDPDDFADIISKIRTHCDRLDEIHSQLVQIRTEWLEAQA